ncbi:MAG: hypothetical protein HC877_11035 [Thioploca sp.]|nr:hypothetical protein [Thioploca sp.]
MSIADNDCGTDDPDAPNPHWVDTCPSGFDKFPTTGTISIALGWDTNPVMGRTDCSHEDAEGVYKITLKGPTWAFRGDGTNSTTPHSIQTEMYDLEMSGNTPFGPVTLYAGDGVGNLADDGPIIGSLYSPGEIEENSSSPGKANSYFDVKFELHTPMGILHNNLPYRMETDGMLGVPPVPLKHADGTYYTTTYLHPTLNTYVGLVLYNEAEQPTACFKVKEIGVPSGTHLSVDLKSFTASANNRVVSIAWETGTETNNAAFRVLRGIPLTGICSDNPKDYIEIEAVSPRISSKGTERSGAVYGVPDNSVISGMTYCYALEDIDYDNQSTFHTDQIVSVTVN